MSRLCLSANLRKTGRVVITGHYDEYLAESGRAWGRARQRIHFERLSGAVW